MTDVHKINKITYDVRFSSEELAYEFQSHANVLVKSSILPTIDEVLCQLDESEKNIVIDTLEIDLGKIQYETDENEIKNLLKTELTKTLKDKISHIKQSPTEQEKVVRKDESECEQLFSFIEKGHLLWNTDTTATSIDKKLKTTLQKKTNTFINWIRTRGQNKTVRKRIICQFNDKTIHDIIIVLDSVNAKFISDYITEVCTLHKHKALLPLSNNAFREVNWEIVLKYILSDRGSRFNKKSFLALVIQKLAQSQNIEYHVLLFSIAKVIQQLTTRSILQTEFSSIIIELTEDYTNTENKTIRKVTKPDSNAIVTELHSFIHQKPTYFNFTELEKFATAFPHETFTIFIHYIATESSRQKLVNRFSETEIKQIIGYIELAHSTVIYNFASKLEESNNVSKIDNSKENFRKIKWLVILSSLHDEQGSRFNQKSFIKASIQKLAAHYNMSHKELILLFENTIHTKNKSQSSLTVLQEAITELSGFKETTQLTQPTIDAATIKYLETEELFDDIIYYIEKGYTQFNLYQKYKITNISQLFIKLSVISREHLNHIFSLLLRKESKQQLIRNCSENCLVTLIALYLQYQNNANKDDAESFCTAIKEQALCTVDLEKYYATIIDLLIGKRQIDIETISTNINQEWDSTLQFKPYQKYNFTTIKQHLFRLLQKKQGSQICSMNFSETLKYLQQHYRNDFSAIVKTIISHKEYRHFFIKKHNNADLLSIIKNSDFNKAEVDILCTILQNTECKQLLTSQLRKRVWKSIFDLFFLNNIFEIKQRIEEIIHTITSHINNISVQEKFLKNIIQQPSNIKNFEQEDLIKTIHTVQKRIEKTNSKNTEQQQQEELYTQVWNLLDGKYNRLNSIEKLLPTLLKLFKKESQKISSVLLRNIQKRDIRNFWVRNLPESILRLIFLQLFPNNYCMAQSAIDIMWNAGKRSIETLTLKINSKEKWILIFDILAHANRNTQYKDISNAFIYHLITKIPKEKHSDFETTFTKEIQTITTTVNREIYSLISKQLKTAIAKNDTQENSQINTETSDEIDETTEETENITETIYIENAGMVLAAPYIPELFKRLGLIEAGKFIYREKAERAIHLLQYMVHECTDHPEFMLLLNKILCGIKTGVPIIRSIDISPEEKETIQQLTEGIIHNWSAIGKTSVQGLRESFLQRKASLQVNHDGQWKLIVENKTYDMLLDKLPWNFSTIKYPWMEKAVYVEWR